MGGRLAVFAGSVALICSVVAILLWMGGQGAQLSPEGVLALLGVNCAILLALGTLVARRIAKLWAQRREGAAGSELHAKLVFMFGLVTATPAILVALFSVIFLHAAVDSWFSEKVKRAVEGANAVADSYLAEHKQSIRADALAMSNGISREGRFIYENPINFGAMVNALATLHKFTEAVVFEGNGRILARTGFSFMLSDNTFISPEAMDRARRGEIAVLDDRSDDRVRAMVKIDRFIDTFLHVGRLVDPRVIDYVSETAGAESEYRNLQQNQSRLMVGFGATFAVVALLLLLAAAWYGLSFATALSRPITALVGAAEAARAGDLSVRVPESGGEEELLILSRAFNRMTHQLEAQRHELVDANRQIDDRRIFTEAVLEGVSAGVIGLDRDRRVELSNRNACVLLETSAPSMSGRPLAALIADIEPLLDRAAARPRRTAEAQVSLGGRQPKTLLVRVAAERGERGVSGFVVTFNDITELLQAQRMAAWADVARRIAHEIKNPLTPIQLSAERLKRKYLNQIGSDPDTFADCIETIVRQVGDIGQMVDEFSAFARMPKPRIERANMAEIVRQALTLHSAGRREIKFAADLPDEPVWAHCDSRLIGQALTNLIQNAVDSIEAKRNGSGDSGAQLKSAKDCVMLRLSIEADNLTLEIEDTGRGLPRDGRSKLTEPYVTHRPKGTGLGLAIVKKIMEDHGGAVRLVDADGGGALVRLVFPVRPEDDKPEDDKAEFDKSETEKDTLPGVA